MPPTTSAGAHEQQLGAKSGRLARLPVPFDGWVDGMQRAYLGSRRTRIAILRDGNVDATHTIYLPEQLIMLHEQVADDIAILARSLAPERRHALWKIHHDHELLWGRNIAMFRHLSVQAFNSMVESGYLTDEAVLTLEVLPLAALSGNAMRWGIQRGVVAELGALLGHMEYAVPGTRLTLINGSKSDEGRTEMHYGPSTLGAA